MDGENLVQLRPGIVLNLVEAEFEHDLGRPGNEERGQDMMSDDGGWQKSEAW